MRVKQADGSIVSIPLGSGTDGGYYIPSVTDNGNNTITISFTPSSDDMPAVDSVTFNAGDIQTVEEMLQGFDRDPGSVKDYIDSVASTKESFIKSTTSCTPAEVLDAMAQGVSIIVTHTDATYGELGFDYFAFSEMVGLVASTVFETEGVRFCAQLIGYISTNRWEFNAFILPTMEDIPDIPDTFGKIVVGCTTIVADNEADSLTLVGSNITLTPDATNDKVTIGLTKNNVTSALGYTPPTTDTTYSAGTGVSLNGTTFSNSAPLYSVTNATVIDAGSSTSGAYLATKWAVANVDGVTTPTDGMTIALRVPEVGVSGGILLSIDNGTTYYPVIRNVSTLITTHYGKGASLVLTFNSTQTANVYTTAGKTETLTGCWQIADYDSDTKTRSSNNAGKKLYIIGATSQSTSGQTTYSNVNCYIGTNNRMYSGGELIMNKAEITALATEVATELIDQRLGEIENGTY
jgi:hypothetical protein